MELSLDCFNKWNILDSLYQVFIFLLSIANHFPLEYENAMVEYVAYYCNWYTDFVSISIAQAYNKQQFSHFVFKALNHFEYYLIIFRNLNLPLILKICQI